LAASWILAVSAEKNPPAIARTFPLRISEKVASTAFDCTFFTSAQCIPKIKGEREKEKRKRKEKRQKERKKRDKEKIARTFPLRISENVASTAFDCTFFTSAQCIPKIKGEMEKEKRKRREKRQKKKK
jgi:hypothetical protein